MCPYNMNDAGIQYSTEPSCLQIYLKKKKKTKQVNPFIVVIFYVFETERLCNVPLSVKLATLTFSENSMKELQKFN